MTKYKNIVYTSSNLLTNNEFNFFKENNPLLLKTYNQFLQMPTNKGVVFLYDYFEKYLPGLFCKLCKVVLNCNIIDLRKEKPDEQLYNRYLRYADFYFNPLKKQYAVRYRNLFQHKQFLILQHIPAKKEQKGIYWWIEKNDLQYIDALINYVSFCATYKEFLRFLHPFVLDRFFKKPSIYMNEPVNKLEQEKILEENEQLNLLFKQKIDKIYKNILEEEQKQTPDQQEQERKQLYSNYLAENSVN